MRIVAAAIRYELIDSDEGWVDIDRRHESIRTKNAKYYTKEFRDNVRITEGFWTDTDNFVDRYTAKEIAVAANQLIVPIEETYLELYSEDVW